jgi:hypothetical protein
MTARLEHGTAKNTVRTDEDFRRVVEQIADQLCLTIGGNFDHLVRVEAQDDTIEKLEMVVNFVHSTSRLASSVANRWQP